MTDKRKLLVGLERWQDYFTSIKALGSWNHAYIISGPRGVGKKELAITLIRSLVCSGDTDVKCISCQAWRKNEEGKLWHPDLIILKPDEKTGAVSIELVRKFLEQVSSSPSVSKRRVALIPNLALLNIQGFNALLKTLEEPPRHLTIIGLVEHADLLPATVISRVHHCAISPTNHHDLTGYLSLSFSREDSAIASDLSYGRPAWAEKLLTDKARAKEYKEEALQFINDCLKDRARAFSKVDELITDSNDRYKLNKLLDHWQLIVRDILLLKSGLVNRVGHDEFRQDLDKLSERGTILTWSRAMDELLDTTSAISANGHKRLQIGKFILTIPVK